VAVEAMASARAVIMSRVGGMPEVVPGGRTGLLVEPNNVGQLAEALERLAGDWDLARRLGEEGRKLVQEEFVLEKHLQTLFRLYEEARSGLPTVGVPATV
jgi:glycosyltransferase involved in cell wall biosynthesis